MGKRYILEYLQMDVPVKREYSYSRLALSCLMRDMWKQLAVSEDIDTLVEYAERISRFHMKKFRISNNEGFEKTFEL